MKKVMAGKSGRLTRDAIAQAALLLIEEEGLSSLSARRLATRVECEPMSLYYHFSNMDALRDEIVEQLLGRLPAVGDGGQADRADVANAARAFLSLAKGHPNAFVLVATRRWTTSKAVAAAYEIVNAFMSAGLSAPEALSNARILGAYLNGAALALTAWYRDTAPETKEQAGQVSRDLDEGIDRMLDVLWPESAP